MKSSIIKMTTIICMLPIISHAIDKEIENTISQSIKTLMPDVEITSIKNSPMPDIYQVESKNNFIYISADGRYLIQGDMLDVENRWNLTEQERSKGRKEILDQINEDELIVFKAKDEKQAIYVFTDIDCGYCQKLHRDIDVLNNLGITVKYLAFPRTDEYTPAWNKISEVWCADDKLKAMTDAKERRDDNIVGDKSVEGIFACGEIVQKHFELGNTLGVMGTPGIFLDNGNVIKGYMPPERLAEKINNMSVKTSSL